MPISYRVDESKQRIYAAANERLTFEDLIRDFDERATSPSNHYSRIYDFRGTFTNVTIEQVHELVEKRRGMASKVPPAPVALVADQDSVFARLRIFDMRTEEIRPIRVFRDFDEAERWLDEQ